MSLITKQHLSTVLQVIKKLLSFKADKSELATKIDRSEIEPTVAIELVAETGLVEPATDNGAIFTDENGNIYSL
jgi:hypothetical protein